MLCSQTKIRNSGKKVCFTKFFIKCYLNLYTRARNQFLKTAGDRHQCFRDTKGCMQIMRSCFMILKVSPFALWGKYSKSRRNESYVSIMNIRQLHWYESVITQRRKNFHAVTKPHMSFHNYANYACFDQSQTKKFI